MKKIYITILLAIFMFPLSAESSFLGMTFTGLPENFLYESYLADPLAVNTEITYSNYDIEEIHPNEVGQEGHIDVKVGTRFNFF